LKHHLFSLLLLTTLFSATQAQDLVYPNVPRAMLKSNQGLITMVEYHGGAGVGNGSVLFSKKYSGIDALIGYQINRSFIIAAGTGLSIYNGGSLIPAYMDLRYTFYFSRVAGYLFADYGLLMNVSNFDSTRMFMNPGIGARYSISRQFALTLATGILIQTSDQNLNAFVNLRAGVTYKFGTKTSGFRIKSVR
jgi:hypothetical protein